MPERFTDTLTYVLSVALAAGVIAFASYKVIKLNGMENPPANMGLNFPVPQRKVIMQGPEAADALTTQSLGSSRRLDGGTGGALEGYDLLTVVDGVAVVALDHPRVREAINALADRGVSVVTLVSDVPSSKRIHYVGIDNSAAGRTAATLMGRYLSGRKGKVGLVAGSLALRDHIERQFGFEQVLAHEYPNLHVLPVRESRDDWRKLEEMTAQLLAEHPDLLGIYNVGGGTRGIVSALEAAGRARDVVLLGHDLSDANRKALIRGTIDAVINQDPGHEVRSAIRVLIAKADNVPLIESQERIRIDIFLRDNLP